MPIVKKTARIEWFPISFFSLVMGLTGFTIALQKLETILRIPIHFSQYVLFSTIGLFVIFCVMYALKILFYSHAVKKEFNNPVSMNFFSTFSISLLLLSAALLTSSPSMKSFARYMWITGFVLHFLLMLKIISIWFHNDKFEVHHMNPAWFLTPVGNILVPIAGVYFSSHEFCWFFLSVGLMLWFVLLVIFFNRIIFHSPLPEHLLPTFFILLAPPAVTFISLVGLIGSITIISKIFYYFSLFLAILLVTQIKIFYKIKFSLAWWAYSFPTTALTIASIIMFEKSQIIAFKFISYFFITIVCAIILMLSLRTLSAMFKKRICLPPESQHPLTQHSQL